MTRNSTSNGSNGHAWSGAFAAEETSATVAELDGLRVVFDQKVGLHPANLQKRSAAPLRARAASLGRARTLRGGRHGG
jgi:hypothetical protein